MTFPPASISPHRDVTAVRAVRYRVQAHVENTLADCCFDGEAIRLDLDELVEVVGFEVGGNRRGSGSCGGSQSG
jgi:hypothetical protein